MAAKPDRPEDSQAAIAAALQDVTEKTQQLVRDEIELAKAEVTAKVKSLARGAVIGVAAGIFVLVGLFFILQGLAWFLYWVIPIGGDFEYFWGFWILAAILFLAGALAGYLAAKAFKKGAPPTPKMAIEEAQLIKSTVQSSKPEERG